MHCDNVKFEISFSSPFLFFFNFAFDEEKLLICLVRNEGDISIFIFHYFPNIFFKKYNFCFAQNNQNDLIFYTFILRIWL